MRRINRWRWPGGPLFPSLLSVMALGVTLIAPLHGVIHTVGLSCGAVGVACAVAEIDRGQPFRPVRERRLNGRRYPASLLHASDPDGRDDG